MSDPQPTSSGPADQALRQRARRVVPGGMSGHLNAAALPAGYPQFFQRGDGCRLWDVDGREFIDFMCGWGPNLLGWQHSEVEAAARTQAALGDCLNGPTPRFVELAEALVDTIAHADWVLFQKNGTDATTVALMVARAATGRRKVIAAQGSYHGAAPWCTPVAAGTTAEDRAHLIRCRYNDVASLEAAVAQAGDDLAAVLLAPIRHDLGIDQEAPAPAFAQAARRLCDRAGAALVLDEVRTSCRLHLAGSWEPLGVRPDLAAWSKAIANGHALAAVTGADALRDAATRIFTTGSFWAGGVAMAAALATLAVARRDGLVAHLERVGGLFRQGLAEQATSLGVHIRQSGPVQMPLVLFDDDPAFAKVNAFCAEALRHGVYLHPKHNMFLSAAHTEADIAQALRATEAGLQAVRRQFGAG
ncbi:MAG TPA: aminotransferase class III-fold pyridoxal phosphate-dependent enzyme [Aquabacterium sp.]|nr:aminotransferase class III-fold pyridoxal phosphate-dependent enzyme [Aquabacterium sp.]HQC96745.1 aminotransferase class III-fold pyridoxal phosphate-dependent enzyme [Aquabacterium sp.]